MLTYKLNDDLVSLNNIVDDAKSATERFPTVDIDVLLNKVYDSYNSNKDITFDILEAAALINMWFSTNLIKSNILFRLFDLDKELNKLESLTQTYEYKDILNIIIKSKSFKRIFDYIIIDFINESCAQQLEKDIDPPYISSTQLN